MADSWELESQSARNKPQRDLQSSRARWFASGLVLLLVIALAASLWASAQPWFFYHVGNPFLESYGYSHRAYGLNCDILLSGDSTGVADLVPAVIEARTKLKTCNVGEVRSNLDFAGTHYPIDDYLGHNRPPRFLVTGWSPGNLNLEHPPLRTVFVDAFAYGMQNRPGPWMWRVMLTRPGPALTAVIWAGSSLMKDQLHRINGRKSIPPQVDERARRDSARGMYYVQVPPQTACEPDPQPFSAHAQNAVSVAEFRRHYATPQTQVMVYVTPVASCDPRVGEWLAASQGLGERPLQLRPASDFNQTDIHLTPERANLYSAQVADDILARMRSQPSMQSASRMPR